MGKLILVGAGPGDEELITVKGMKALQTADVVLYDALANPALLNYCGPGCDKVFVGKRAGLHFMKQVEINELILSLVKDGKTVVRLKGGDPFVFGRGHEEMEYVTQHGAETEVIPGISSSMAVPCSQHIPVTKRGINESFWVVTGATKSHKASADIQLAAQSSATVIILMGMKNLSEIVNVFKQQRGIDEPVGIIMNGTTDKELSGFGTLENIEQIAQTKGLGAPAIIVIGDVVRERLKTPKENNLSDLVAMAVAR
ncbi:MAG: uroporphyrinogen-III C-methyltransferase [Bacteroidota bacterium]